MLKSLHVRDLALVERAEVGFQRGLNLLTGETGSGKSLVVDALGLALGGRASTDQVRHGADRALVEASFETDGGELALGREVGRRGQARIDGRPTTPAQLRELGRRLVGVHGQHEHHSLLDTEAQTDLLDAFAGVQGLREAVASAHEAWTSAAQHLAGLERMRDRGEREREYLLWQLDELRGADLRPGEDDELANERSVARHAARLQELAGTALEALRGDEGLGAASADIRAAAELDSRLQPLAERVAALEEEAADLAAELRRYAEVLDADPRRLEQIEERLALLESLKRKHGGSLESAIAERDRLAEQLGEAEDLGSAIEAARGRADRLRADLVEAAGRLTLERERAAQLLGAAVASELQGLRLEGARFEVRLVSRPEITPAGAELAEMVFSANPGEPLASLARVASGGELARVMLAIKSATAEADRLPTLVFDEVDAGIGGEAALQVGLRLKALGAHHQVLVVTHLPQIACFADHHLVVEKAPGRDGRNVVRVRELNGDDERAAELARMMSGRVTDKALARAHELLEEARQ
ncbi:MAG TPA: DNA repair protein RecN [Candidatus Dormibacteraeota bacterium]